MIFRVPQDHDGLGIVCPGCRRLLRVPGPEDEPPPLMAPLRKVESVVADAPEEAAAATTATTPSSAASQRTAATEGGQRLERRRRKRKARQDDGPSWEHSGSRRAGEDSRLESRRMGWWLGGGAVLLAGIITVVVLALKSAPQQQVVAPQAVAPAAVPTPQQTAEAVSDLELIRLAEPLARQFLNARTIEECLPLVREPQRAGPRMRQYHPDGTIPPVGLGEFRPDELLERENGIVTIQIRDAQFEPRLISFQETPAGLKVDWEAWVGWCESGWDEFAAKRSAQSTLFRVILEPVDYYNFDFSNETEWSCYRLSSRTGDQVLYGYVQRGSPLDAQLKPAPEIGRTNATLKLRFPAQAATRNQVLIDAWLGNCWSISTEPSP